MQSCIYEGKVRHTRLAPVQHHFSYRMYMLYMDLAELPDLFKPFRFWSADRPSIAWFNRADHTGNELIPLEKTIRDLIWKRTGKIHRGPIRLLTHLRYFGYCFNPVSFYYCWNAYKPELDFIVAEVHNTPWGETHCYVMDCKATEGEQAHCFTFDKAFHVSPFMGMQQHYDWLLPAPADDLRVTMKSTEQGDKVFMAHMDMQRVPISAKSLNRVLLRYPLMTIKVIAAIYWQALRLWLKKTPFYSHPKNPLQETDNESYFDYPKRAR